MLEIIKRLVPDSVYLKLRFKKIMMYPLDLKNPKTFNEKLQWLKLYNRKSEYTKMVDKYEAKKHVAGIIGEEYIIPTLGVWENVDEIDFDELPDQFVLKCTHDSGSYIICPNKNRLDIVSTKNKLENSLKHNFYWESREWPYKNVKPRIIAEEFIGFYPKDYKFFVFNGDIDSIMVCKDRDKGYPSFYFYDINWNRLYYQHEELEKNDQVEKPENLDLMVKLVKKLAKGFAHVRIDLYNVNGTIYFGEYTLFNQSGFDTDITYETDLMWGKLLTISECR